VADACSATGCPGPPLAAYLARRSLTSPWEAQPLSPPAVPDAPPGRGSGAARGGARGGEGEEEADAPEDVACVDPLAGALQMGLLQRVR
jgi:hypothetical protein